jgi:hypothetical protein
MTEFRALLESLCDARVEFILIGGVAAVLHGSARMTQDVNVVYSRSDENLDRVADALCEHQPYLRGAPPGLPFQWNRATIQAGLIFTLTIRCIGLDALIRAKRAAGRPKDLEVIAELEALREERDREEQGR